MSLPRTRWHPRSRPSCIDKRRRTTGLEGAGRRAGRPPVRLLTGALAADDAVVDIGLAHPVRDQFHGDVGVSSDLGVVQMATEGDPRDGTRQLGRDSFASETIFQPEPVHRWSVNPSRSRPRLAHTPIRTRLPQPHNTGRGRPEQSTGELASRNSRSRVCHATPGSDAGAATGPTIALIAVIGAVAVAVAAWLLCGSHGQDNA